MVVSQHVLVGKRLKDVRFRQTYGAAVLGVHRSGDCQLSLTMCTRFLLSANCLPHQCISTVNGLLANVFFAEQTNQKQAKHLACKSFCCSRALNARTKGTMLEDMSSSNLHHCLHPLLCMTAGGACRASCCWGHQRHPTVCRRYLSG